MSTFHTISKKIATGFLALIIAVTAVYAPITPYSVPRAHALWGILDTNITDVLSFALDGVAWAIAKAAVNAMTQSMVTWINSGFNGSPAFATNLNANLRQVGDTVAARFVDKLTENVKIDSPLLEQIAPWVAGGYLLYTSQDRLAARLQYTLNRYATDPDAWVRGDFSQGGFNAWMATTWTCGNDPQCVEFVAQEELINSLDSNIQERLSELSYGRGFMSWKNCPDYEQEDGVDTTVGGASLSDEDRMVGCTISTPGSVIESQLEHQLGSGVRQLEIADSINEIVGALAAQIVKQALGGSGLLGASQPSEGGGRSFLDQVANESSAQTAEALSQGFRDSVERERAWARTLQTAAAAANEKCQVPGSDTEKATEVAATLTRMTTVGAELDDILTRVTQAQTLSGARQSAFVSTISSDYSRILSSGRIPTRGDVSTDAEAEPTPLLVRLNEITEDGCD